MATVRLDMRKTREILRLKWEQGLSHRQIARSLGLSAGVVGSTMSRAKRAGLLPTTLGDLSDEDLERRLYGVKAAEASRAGLPAPEHIHNELKRPGVTLELLHIEYLSSHPATQRFAITTGGGESDKIRGCARCIELGRSSSWTTRERSRA